MSVLELTRGDDRVLDVALSEAVSDGALLEFTVKRSYADSDEDAVITKSSDVDGEIAFEESAGTASITIDAVDTQDLDVAPAYVWDVQMTSSAGKITTVARGRFVIIPDVTRGDLGS